MNEEMAKVLRERFPDSMVGKLPRVTCRQCRDAPQRVCSDHRKDRCKDCGGYMTTAHIHLDYVGHAAVTDRLLQADPEWTWEPMAFDDNGEPMTSTRNGMASLWCRLTVGGVTRPAVGSAEAGKPEVLKELISDMLRNGAMRFGVALDLWSKEDLHVDDDGAPQTPREYVPPTSRDQGPMKDPDGEPTSRGNTRRGPRVLDGWKSLDEQRGAHSYYQELGKAQPAAVQAQIKAWTAEQDMGWPMSKADLEAAQAKLVEFAGGEAATAPSCPSCGEPLTEANERVEDGCGMCAPMNAPAPTA